MNMKCLKINYPKDKTYLVAVSGGPDSMALLNMLYSLKYKLVICHVNYHKRKESDFEEQELCKYAKERNIPVQNIQFIMQKVYLSLIKKMICLKLI